MSAVSIGISISTGATKKLILSPVMGPVQMAGPSVDPYVAQVGVITTRTPGTYQPRGGGNVTLNVSEWRIGSVPVSTGPDYTPTATDVGETLYYVEQAIETGGTADGPLPATVINLGPVAPVAPAISTLSATQSALDAPLDITVSFINVESPPITCHFVGVLSGETTPSLSQIIAGQASDGLPAQIVTSFSASVDGTESTTFSDVASGLYDLYAVAVDAAGTPSGIAAVPGIDLAYSTPPSL